MLKRILFASITVVLLLAPAEARGGIPPKALNVARSLVKAYVEGPDLVSKTKDFLNQALREAGKQPGNFTVGGRYHFIDLKEADVKVDDQNVQGVLLTLDMQIWVDPDVGENDAFAKVDIFIGVTQVQGKRTPITRVVVRDVRVDSESFFGLGTFPGKLRGLVDTKAGPAIDKVVREAVEHFID